LRILRRTWILGLALFVFPLAAQEVKTVDDYCVQTGKSLSDMDAMFNAMEKLAPDFSEEYRQQLFADIAKLKAYRKTTLHDACVAPDLKTAKVNVKRDMDAMTTFTTVVLVRATKRLAELYRKQAE
jgi:hypothetical protein